MNNDTYENDQPSEEELARFAATLHAHAEEIALACAGAGDDWLVYAVTEQDGTWWGTMMARRQEEAGPCVADGMGLCFVFPARCRTPEVVHALIREHLGPAAD